MATKTISVLNPSTQISLFDDPRGVYNFTSGIAPGTNYMGEIWLEWSNAEIGSLSCSKVELRIVPYECMSSIVDYHITRIPPTGRGLRGSRGRGRLGWASGWAYIMPTPKEVTVTSFPGDGFPTSGNGTLHLASFTAEERIQQAHISIEFKNESEILKPKTAQRNILFYSGE